MSDRQVDSTVDRRTDLYIGAVVVLCVVLAAVCARDTGPPTDWLGVGVLAVVGITAWLLPTTAVGKARFNIGSIVLLAGVGIAGPLGAGIIGLLMATFERGRLGVRRRLFNGAMSASSSMTAGLAYLATGGAVNAEEVTTSVDVALHIGGPMVVADAVQLLVNALLLAGVLQLTAGVPLRLQLMDMFLSSGLTQFAYGAIAFILVVLWLPGGLGPVAVAVVAAPMVGARWALVQYVEQRNARERALGALSAAIETRAPHLQGHGARVSQLAARMAQELGLGPQQVGDVRTAGLLHDLGTVVVAPGHESADEATGAARREEDMLRDLPFLAGASAVMREVALGPSVQNTPSLGAEIVLAADAYDLATHGADPVSPAEGLAAVRTGGRVTDARVLEVLQATVRDMSAGVT